MAFVKPAARVATTTGRIEIHAGTDLENGQVKAFGYLERSLVDAQGEQVGSNEQHNLSLLTQTEQNQLQAMFTRLRNLSNQNVAS